MSAMPSAGSAWIVRPVASARARNASCDGREQLARRAAVAPQRQPTVVGLREHEQVLREAHQPVGLRRGRPQRLLDSAAVLGFRSARSSSAFISASGVRSSWLASATKLRSRWMRARGARASRSASRPAVEISSCALPAGSRRPGSAPRSPAASTRISSTGRSAAPATSSRARSEQQRDRPDDQQAAQRSWRSASLRSPSDAPT